MGNPPCVLNSFPPPGSDALTSVVHYIILSAAGSSKDKGVDASNTEQAKQETKGM
jgi:hypothetical protein